MPNVKTTAVQICKASWEVIKEKLLLNEQAAHTIFDEWAERNRVSEFNCSGTVGYLRLIADWGGQNYIRRELYLKA